MNPVNLIKTLLINAGCQGGTTCHPSCFPGQDRRLAASATPGSPAEPVGNGAASAIAASAMQVLSALPAGTNLASVGGLLAGLERPGSDFQGDTGRRSRRVRSSTRANRACHSGFCQRRLGNREKSASHEDKTAPYSNASAARWASPVRLPAVPVA
jgi:hypothetical protein